MKNLLRVAIDELEDRARCLDEVGEPGSYECGMRMQFAVNTLTNFRDTLISIANCQGAIPSHQARDVLIQAGLCDHGGLVYSTADVRDRKRVAPFVCHKCGLSGDERPVPFQ